MTVQLLDIVNWQHLQWFLGQFSGINGTFMSDIWHREKGGRAKLACPPSLLDSGGLLTGY